MALRLRICRIWPTENLTFYCFALGKLFASAQFWNICSSLEVANSHFSVLSHSTVILSNFRSLFYDPIYTPRRVRNIAALHLLFSSLFILRQLIMTGLHYDKSVKIVFFYDRSACLFSGKLSKTFFFFHRSYESVNYGRGF